MSGEAGPGADTTRGVCKCRLTAPLTFLCTAGRPGNEPPGEQMRPKKGASDVHLQGHFCFSEKTLSYKKAS